MLLMTIALCIWLIHAQIKVSTNERYTKTGSFMLDSSLFNTNDSVISFNMTYNRTFPQNPLVYLLSIETFQFNIIDNLIDFNITTTNVLANMMQAEVGSSVLSRIIRLTVIYFLAVEQYSNSSLFQVLPPPPSAKSNHIPKFKLSNINKL